MDEYINTRKLGRSTKKPKNSLRLTFRGPNKTRFKELKGTNLTQDVVKLALVPKNPTSCYS